MYILVVSNSIGQVCRNNKGCIMVSFGKMLGDVSVLVAEAIAICKADRTISDCYMDKILIENDSQIVINSIRGSMKVASRIEIMS